MKLLPPSLTNLRLSVIAEPGTLTHRLFKTVHARHLLNLLKKGVTCHRCVKKGLTRRKLRLLQLFGLLSAAATLRVASRERTEELDAPVRELLHNFSNGSLCGVLLSAVITSCSESEKELHRAIHSFVAQGFMPVSELIIVHDACDPRSFRSAMKSLRLNPDVRSVESMPDQVISHATCKSNVIKVVEHVSNCGLSCARNTGTRLGSGQYIWPIDADDYLSKGLLNMLFSALLRANVSFLDPQRLNVIMPGMGTTKGTLGPWQPRDVDRTLKYANQLHCCGLIHRSVYDNVNYNDALVFGWEDWQFWIRMQHTVGIRMYLFHGPWYIYTSFNAEKDHLASFCNVHHDICTAVLRVASCDYFSRAEAYAAVRLLQHQAEVIATSKQFEKLLKSAQLGNPTAHLLLFLVQPEIQDHRQHFCARTTCKSLRNIICDG